MTMLVSSPAERLRLEAGIRRLVGLAVLSLRRARERWALLDLDADRLRDIGLTKDEVRLETGRWPWDGRERGL